MRIPAKSSLLGGLPTPVTRLDALCSPEAELWVKDDGRTHALYGGNKVRKLERILAAAQAQGAQRILTAGGAGSHHVLATAVFARQRSLSTLAVLCPQPWTEHCEATLRASIACGVEVVPVSSMAAVPWALLDSWRPGDCVVPVGGWGVGGSLGYADAVEELVFQVQRGELPLPDVIVTALGSGGTAAGLLAGLAGARLPTGLLATSVAVRSERAARWLVQPLAGRALRRAGLEPEPGGLARRLLIDCGKIGAGYGAATPAATAALALAARVGLALDQTYTAKAFATALDLLGPESNRTACMVRHQWKPPPDRPLRVLYWHTLSAAPLEALGGDVEAPVPERLRTLLHRG